MYVIRQILLKIKNDRRAVTALEYGLIAALIAAVIIGAVTTLGDKVSTTFRNVSNSMPVGTATSP